MNNVDEQYIALLKDILANGKKKTTRAGEVLSVFGRQLKFNLQEGVALLTTKKVFTKGVLIELLWFLQRPYNSHGSMNIRYLIENKVHIWDADAYRWMKEWIKKEIINRPTRSFKVQIVRGGDDELGEHVMKDPWKENGVNRDNDLEWLMNIDEGQFLELVMFKIELNVLCKDGKHTIYRFGDLGPVYGKQWRSFGVSGTDQIQEIIKTLKTNPNDRRMVCMAYNPDVLKDVALPPCHVMMQFYTRPLTEDERVKIFKESYEWENDNWEEQMNKRNIPKYGLSCMWTQRSVDVGAGLPFNCLSYTVLTYMIAKLVNMVPDKLVGSLGDTHIYMNHYDALKEQTTRNGSEKIPQLVIHGNQERIEDFKIEDFEFVDYEPDPPIKLQLNVG